VVAVQLLFPMVLAAVVAEETPSLSIYAFVAVVAAAAAVSVVVSAAAVAALEDVAFHGVGAFVGILVAVAGAALEAWPAHVPSLPRMAALAALRDDAHALWVLVY